MSSGRNGASGEEQRGLSPRSRRAFGCVTWVYMGMLTFLAVDFVLSLPFRYLGGAAVYSYVVPTLAYLGTVVLVPGMVLAAVLGARSYRAPRRVAGRVGAGVGALIGWSGLLSLVWVAGAFGFAGRDQAFNNETFAHVGGPGFYFFPPLTVVAAALVLFALYSRGADPARRRNLGFAGAALAVVAGVALVASNPDFVGVTAVLISTLSAAAAGWVGGIGGYARAGGDEMIPPGAVPAPKRQRRRPR